jgi:hypothetical protein
MCKHLQHVTVLHVTQSYERLASKKQREMLQAAPCFAQTLAIKFNLNRTFYDKLRVLFLFEAERNFLRVKNALMALHERASGTFTALQTGAIFMFWIAKGFMSISMVYNDPTILRV